MTVGLLQQKNLLNQLSQSDLITLRDKVEKSLQRLHKSHANENLVVNSSKETWMDTLSRDGARIEIQALQLATYKTARLLNDLTLTHSEKYSLHEKQLRQVVRSKFFNGRQLADGYLNETQDFTIRPNIFIAYYVYPDLLSTGEWEAVFDNALQHLWLSWGGLATLDISHPDFKQSHSGEGSASYHNGDSWYWINNLAALCMLRLNRSKYKEYIYKIIEASVHDMLYSGFIGHCSEISSAKERSSFGCWAQAWSAATLVELLHEVHK